MVGERIRQARLVAGLSQDQVIAKLIERGVKLTKAGLSKYERGGSIPPATVVLHLSHVLSVAPSYFLVEPTAQIQWVAFRKHSTLSKRSQEDIKAVASEQTQNHLWIVQMLNAQSASQFPRRVVVRCAEDAENAASELRVAWGLGEDPIESVVGAVEDNGGVVVEIEPTKKEFHGLSGWAGEGQPVAVISSKNSDDRKRFDLSHELGHLVMDCEARTPREEEGFAHRFASAFIVPRKAVFAELGTRRRNLSLRELAILKTKYGMSMQAWARRALDLEIIEPSHYTSFCRNWSMRGWRQCEPVQFNGNESPVRFKQLILRALAENIITPSRAEGLCPGITRREDLNVAMDSKGMTAVEAMRLPLEERRQLLRASVEAAMSEYQESDDVDLFEALSQEDFLD